MSKIEKVKVFGFEFTDFTDEYFKALFYDPKEVWRGRKFNGIKTMPSLIVGTTGSGKSTVQKFINSRLFETYKKFGFCAVDGDDVELSDFLQYALKVPSYFEFLWSETPGVYSLFFDDATAKEPKAKEIQLFFSMRHKIEQELGLQEGILYTAYATHDWYGLSKIFRRYGQLAIVLSVPPFDVYSRRHIAKMLGETAMKVLDAKYKLALKEDSHKGFGFVKLPYVPDGCDSQVGLFKFERVEFPSISMMPGDSMHVITDPEKLLVKIPQGETINESPDDAKTRYEHIKELNKERQQRYRDRNKLVDENAEPGEPSPPMSKEVKN